MNIKTWCPHCDGVIEQPAPVLEPAIQNERWTPTIGDRLVFIDENTIDDENDIDPKRTYGTVTGVRETRVDFVTDSGSRVNMDQCWLIPVKSAALGAVSGWHQRAEKAVLMYGHKKSTCGGNNHSDCVEARKALNSILAEVHEIDAGLLSLPEPGKIATAIANQIIKERSECYESIEYALEIAAALIKAASNLDGGQS